MTSSRALGRLHGDREAYWTRPPQLWRAATMSCWMSRSIFRGSFGFSRKYWGSLASSLVHQKRMSRRGRGILPSLMRRVRERPISRRLAQPLPSSLADVISSWAWAVRTICWSWISVPWIQPSTRACSGCGGIDRFDVDLHLVGLVGRRQAHPQGPPLARRDHDGEGRGRAVLHARHVLGLVGKSSPGHLVGCVEGVGPVRRVREHPQGPAAPHRLLVDLRQGPLGEHDLPLHVLAGVVALDQAAPHVDELGRHVGRPALVGDGDGDVRVGRELSLLGLHEPGLSERAGPAMAVPLLADQLHVLEAGRGRGSADPFGRGEEVAAAVGAVKVGEVPDVLEAAVPRDLVDEVVEEGFGDEGRRLGEGRCGGGEDRCHQDDEACLQRRTPLMMPPKQDAVYPRAREAFTGGLEPRG